MNNATLEPLVPESRVYTGSVPKGAGTPHIFLSLISNPRMKVGTKMARVQITVTGRDFSEVIEIADVVSSILKDLDGTDEIFAVYNEDMRDLQEPESESYRVMIDGIFYYKETDEFS